MKNTNILYVALAIAAFCFIGCFSTPTPTPKIKNIPYTFGQDENANGTATIIFHNNWTIRLVDFEGEQLPAPEEGTRWYPFQFPAGRSFNLRLYVSYQSYKNGEDQPGYRRRGILKCPPLEAGKTYKLWYERPSMGYFNYPREYYYGAGKLILTYSDVTELKYFLGQPRYKQIHVQEIPSL
ncbi:MAG: hypothetical protein LBI28_11895 [Treponema sp.]|nr:hypothetical protein [Treponema sp.]